MNSKASSKDEISQNQNLLVDQVFKIIRMQKIYQI